MDGVDDRSLLVHAPVFMSCRTHGLEVKVMSCDLAVFEDTYDLAKSSMRSHAVSRQLKEIFELVKG